MRIVRNRSGQAAEEIGRDAAPLSGELAAKALLHRFEVAFQQRDLAAVAACLSPAFEWRPPTGESLVGKEAALAEMARRFGQAGGPEFRKSRFRFHGRTVVQTYRVRYVGADGVRREARGLDVYRIRNGLIARKDAYWKGVP